ncbi:hypothetical protein [Paenibacillus sp. ISL-20]|uniref:hypothetical protein n=1 Tax=Paenibacillus sp. ISL-20 TaxID=2819163 RepID=UPI001BEBF34A|nr:hypothetical protein [Paenibacillus sp. ISL-20]
MGRNLQSWLVDRRDCHRPTSRCRETKKDALDEAKNKGDKADLVKVLALDTGGLENKEREHDKPVHRTTPA